jgi:transcriptional regulator with XRE-family HTH domain
MPESAISFGRRIRELRQRRELSLRGAALQLRISHPYLVQLEQDIETPSEELIRRISLFYGVEASDLLFIARKIDQTLERVATSFPDQTAQTLQNRRRDLFVSHRSTDKAWVRRLAKELEQVNVRGQPLRIWLDEAEIRPGQSITGEINMALETSRFVALVLTPDYFHSPSGWTDAEWQAALFSDPAGRQGRVLPLLVKDCPYVPALLRHLNMIDFRDEREFDRALTRLVAVIGEGASQQPTRARGQLVTQSGAIHSASIVADRAPVQGNPDTVDEILPCNVLPVISMPEFIWIAPLAKGISSDKGEIKDNIHHHLDSKGEPIYTPVFALNSSQVLSFYDLSAEEGPFSTVVVPKDTRRIPVISYLTTDDTQRVFVSLLNMHIGRHCYSPGVGLVTARDDDRRRYFFPVEEIGKDKEFRWRRSARPRTVLKHYRDREGCITFCRHLAAELPIAQLGSRFYLKINPTWLFTTDGSANTLMKGRRVGVLAMRWMGRERNVQILYHTRFWAYVLARGRSVINVLAGDQSLLIDTQPAFVRVKFGIRDDHLNLERIVQQVADDFDWNEDEVFEQLERGGDDGN